MQYAKIIIIYSLRLILKVLYILPIKKNKILFVSHDGRQYSCNPKYMFEYIYNLYKDDYLYIWSLRDRKNIPNHYNNVKTCGYLTLKYIYSIMTAKYIITNTTIDPFFPIRKNQFIIYTWHGGGAYKKAAENNLYKKLNISKMIMRDIRSKMINYVISSCEASTNVYCKVWNISKDLFLPIGMPRNDMLFSQNNEIMNKIYKYYSIEPEKGIVLYAPTFRGNFKKPENIDYFLGLDIENILQLLKLKFRKDFIFLYRFHYVILDKTDKTTNIFSATNYPDMQELLYAADILITDYSSSMWDFSLTFKPCFIYAPDLEKYKYEQGFYTPIEEWPFPVAQSNEELGRNIMQFDMENYNQSVKKHHDDLGSYETGTACEQFCRTVFSNKG